MKDGRSSITHPFGGRGVNDFFLNSCLAVSRDSVLEIILSGKVLNEGEQ